jgi:hypothetical protein
MKKGVSRKAGM